MSRLENFYAFSAQNRGGRIILTLGVPVSALANAAKQEGYEMAEFDHDILLGAASDIAAQMPRIQVPRRGVLSELGRDVEIRFA